MCKWIAGVLATVLSGVLVWALTEGLRTELPESGEKPKQEVQRNVVNTSYLAELVGKEAFTEELPKPLRAEGFARATISDPCAARRLAAVKLKIGVDPSAGSWAQDIRVFAHIEIYRTSMTPKHGPVQAGMISGLFCSRINYPFFVTHEFLVILR